MFLRKIFREWIFDARQRKYFVIACTESLGLEEDRNEKRNSPQHPECAHGNELDILHPSHDEHEPKDSEPKECGWPRCRKFSRDWILLFPAPIFYEASQNDQSYTYSYKRYRLWASVCSISRIWIKEVGEDWHKEETRGI